ncbi:MAG: phage Gp37/Gp68 family protein [Anaerolineae bacterium]|nr:phage Gp37/Gp68 family protein [Anaerolineae bacterium]
MEFTSKNNMAENSKIGWTDHTFNTHWGCEKVSPGCAHCYADAFDHRLGMNHWGKNAPRRFFGEKHWREPLKWNREAKALGVIKKVFSNSMSDICEKRPDLDAPREKVFQMAEETEWLIWMFLTKRPENIYPMMPAHWRRRPPQNVWWGTTVEGQPYVKPRGDALLSVPAPVHFFSHEPLLTPVYLDGLRPEWGIVGGESGPLCRPMELEWARSLRDQYKEIGSAFFMKQLGGHPDPRANVDDFPQDLKIQEFPKVAG